MRRPAAGWLLAGALTLGVVGCGAAPSEAQVPIENQTPQPLRVQVLDRGPDGGLRRRALELPAGGRFALDLRFGQPLDDRGARFEVRTNEGNYFHARYLAPADALGVARGGGAVQFTATDLALDAASRGVAESLRPITVDLAAGKATRADEIDPAGMPDRAVDGDPKTFWRGLTPPPTQVSWAVDLGAPVALERVQMLVECVRCGYVRVRLTLLGEPLPDARFAPAGAAQTETILNLVDRMSGAQLGALELSGSVVDGGLLSAAPPRPIAGVRTVVATIVEAPENIGFYAVRLAGQQGGGGTGAAGG